jgi:hypothetical protein
MNAGESLRETPKGQLGGEGEAIETDESCVGRFALNPCATLTPGPFARTTTRPQR